MVNLCFSESTAGTLRYAFRRQGEETACLPLLLFWGDISDVFDGAGRRTVYEMYHLGYAETVSEFIKNFNRIIKGERSIRIWYSSEEPNEFCGMLHAVSLLRDYNLTVVDCCKKVQKGNRITNYRHSAELDEDTLIDFLQYELAPDETVLLEWRDRWNRLVHENTPLRVIEGGQLISVDIDYYDAIIRGHLSKTETSIARIIGEVISYEHIFSDTFIAERLKCFLERRQLKLVRKKETFYESVVELPE